MYFNYKDENWYIRKRCDRFVRDFLDPEGIDLLGCQTSGIPVMAWVNQYLTKD